MSEPVELTPVQQSLRNCTGCYFENRKTCDDENPPNCGLGEWNSWWIWVEKV